MKMAPAGGRQHAGRLGVEGDMCWRQGLRQFMLVVGWLEGIKMIPKQRINYCFSSA